MKLPDAPRRQVESLTTPLSYLDEQLAADRVNVAPFVSAALKLAGSVSAKKAFKDADEAITRYSQVANSALQTYSLFAERGDVGERDAKDVQERLAALRTDMEKRLTPAAREAFTKSAANIYRTSALNLDTAATKWTLERNMRSQAAKELQKAYASYTSDTTNAINEFATTAKYGSVTMQDAELVIKGLYDSIEATAQTLSPMARDDFRQQANAALRATQNQILTYTHTATIDRNAERTAKLGLTRATTTASRILTEQTPEFANRWFADNPDADVGEFINAGAEWFDTNIAPTFTGLNPAVQVDADRYALQLRAQTIEKLAGYARDRQTAQMAEDYTATLDNVSSSAFTEGSSAQNKTDLEGRVSVQLGMALEVPTTETDPVLAQKQQRVAASRVIESTFHGGLENGLYSETVELVESGVYDEYLDESQKMRLLQKARAGLSSVGRSAGESLTVTDRAFTNTEEMVFNAHPDALDNLDSTEAKYKAFLASGNLTPAQTEAVKVKLARLDVLRQWQPVSAQLFSMPLPEARSYITDIKHAAEKYPTADYQQTMDMVAKLESRLVERNRVLADNPAGAIQQFNPTVRSQGLKASQLAQQALATGDPAQAHAARDTWASYASTQIAEQKALGLPEASTRVLSPTDPIYAAITDRNVPPRQRIQSMITLMEITPSAYRPALARSFATTPEDAVVGHAMFVSVRDPKLANDMITGQAIKWEGTALTATDAAAGVDAAFTKAVPVAMLSDAGVREGLKQAAYSAYKSRAASAGNSYTMDTFIDNEAFSGILDSLIGERVTPYGAQQVGTLTFFDNGKNRFITNDEWQAFYDSVDTPSTFFGGGRAADLHENRVNAFMVDELGYPMPRVQGPHGEPISWSRVLTQAVWVPVANGKYRLDMVRGGFNPVTGRPTTGAIVGPDGAPIVIDAPVLFEKIGGVR